MVPMAPRTVSRRVDMHGDVHNPPKAKRLGELVDAIETWDKLHEKYQEMGGQEVVPDEQCVIILRMFVAFGHTAVPRHEPARYH